MARIVAAGVAVIDFVMHLDEMPSRAEKYRARDAAIVGGGCAATAMVAAARLGGSAALAARLGDDQIGDMIVAGLEAEGVDCSLVRRFAGRRSSFSTVIVSGAGERQIVNFRDMGISFDAVWLEETALPPFEAALGDTRWPQGAAALLHVARERGVPGVLDAEAPVMEAADALSAASHVAFSAQGLRDFTGAFGIPDGLHAASRRIDAWVCVTDGASGVYWIDGGEILHEPAFAVDVVDTLGAGDVWHGAFALGLGEGMGERQAIRFASAAAAIKCTRFGGRDGAPTRAEVEDLLKARTA
jgi:sulfofructose kinase